MMATQTKAAMLVIGDEVLSGRTREANTQTLACKLNEKGIGLGEARIIGDRCESIIEAVNHLRANYDYLFTSGGIGPTHDDITAAAIAAAFELPLLENDEALSILEDHYADEMNDRRRRMARIPQGAALIHNPLTSAPGFRLQNTFVMAGIPDIFSAMVDSILPGLAGGSPVFSKAVITEAPESIMADSVERIADSHNRVTLGSYPHLARGKRWLSLVVRSQDRSMLEEVIKVLEQEVALAGYSYRTENYAI